jgi:hypothetical protein
MCAIRLSYFAELRHYRAKVTIAGETIVIFGMRPVVAVPKSWHPNIFAVFLPFFFRGDLIPLSYWW